MLLTILDCWFQGHLVYIYIITKTNRTFNIHEKYNIITTIYLNSGYHCLTSADKDWPQPQNQSCDLKVTLCRRLLPVQDLILKIHPGYEMTLS